MKRFQLVYYSGYQLQYAHGSEIINAETPTHTYDKLTNNHGWNTKPPDPNRKVNMRSVGQGIYYCVIFLTNEYYSCVWWEMK